MKILDKEHYKKIPDEELTKEQKKRRLRRQFRFVPSAMTKGIKDPLRDDTEKRLSPYDASFILRDYLVNFTNLEIQLKTTNLSKGVFLRCCVRGFLERDPTMIKFVEEYIEQKRTGKAVVERTREILKKEEERYEEVVEKINFEEVLSESETKSIFDLIAGDFDLEDFDESVLDELEMGEDNEDTLDEEEDE